VKAKVKEESKRSMGMREKKDSGLPKIGN